MIAALITSVGFYMALFIIWSIPGMIVITGVMITEWHGGKDITLKEILGGYFGGAVLGWVIAIFGIGYFFTALGIMGNALIQPFNFKIKGRKRK